MIIGTVPVLNADILRTCSVFVYVCEQVWEYIKYKTAKKEIRNLIRVCNTKT